MKNKMSDKKTERHTYNIKIVKELHHSLKIKTSKPKEEIIHSILNEEIDFGEVIEEKIFIININDSTELSI